MSAQTVKWLVTGAFAAHGLGMLGAAGFLPWSIRKGDFVGSSWLLGSGTAATVIGIVVWAIAGIGFLVAALGFWQAAEWWRTAAWVGSIFTVVSIGLWFGAVPFGVYVGGALAIATLVYLIVT